MLAQSDPKEAARLLELASTAVRQRWETYQEMATKGAAEFARDARRAGEVAPEKQPEKEGTK